MLLASEGDETAGARCGLHGPLVLVIRAIHAPCRSLDPYVPQGCSRSIHCTHRPLSALSSALLVGTLRLRKAIPIPRRSKNHPIPKEPIYSRAQATHPFPLDPTSTSPCLPPSIKCARDDCPPLGMSAHRQIASDRTLSAKGPIRRYTLRGYGVSASRSCNRA